MILFPKQIQDIPKTGRIRAGGTDLQARIYRGLLPSDTLVSLRDTQNLEGVELQEDGGYRIGAMTRIQSAATNLSGRGYRGLVQALQGLATPNIRRVATMGGNVFQEIRCPYFRSGIQCDKTEGSSCHALKAQTHHFSLLKTKACISVNPSTGAMALMAYRAKIIWANTVEQEMIEALQNPAGRLCIAIHVPPSTETRGAWKRISPRHHADWPLVEGVISESPKGIRLALGAIAPQPVLLEGTSSKEIRERYEELVHEDQIRPPLQHKKTLLRVLVNSLLEDV